MSLMSVKVEPRPLGSIPLGAILALPLALLPLGAWLVESDLMMLAKCSFKLTFGLPCMGCGATRATLNLLHGDILEAFSFSPMIVMIYLTGLVWGLCSVVSYTLGSRLDVRMANWLTWTIRGLLIVTPFANWFYLMAYQI